MFQGCARFDSHIIEVEERPVRSDTLICPGYIDAHVHIESSMLPPRSFSRVVAPHGTAAVVADPHEIANVAGMDGIEFMVNDARSAPVDIFFAAPSCVPATPFETSGATITAKDCETLLARDEFVALGEMMNYPGVIRRDPDVMRKIATALKRGKPVDGHCPGLSGQDLSLYIAAGISTDHESTTAEEAREKVERGIRVFVREGSSARDLEALAGVDGAFAFCTDDAHVRDLRERGHMDAILSKAVGEGMDPLQALRMATSNPARHYDLPCGTLSPGARAHILVLRDINDFTPVEVYHGGKPCARCGAMITRSRHKDTPMRFMTARPIATRMLRPQAPRHVIGAAAGRIITDHLVDGGTNVDKLVAVDRHTGTHLACCYISGLDMGDCAIAQTIAHDSHNIIAAGGNDGLLVRAVNRLVSLGGGIVACGRHGSEEVSLDIGGLMSSETPERLASRLEGLEHMLGRHGVDMERAVSTLSFMSLLVIPHLKLSDRGLFDVDAFAFIDDKDGDRDPHAKNR
ncbi:MAG TPA: adenine deaminase [Methanomicrobia archaeon]|nr:adenine deaminase [Methanomicrobia archaeon]